MAFVERQREIDTKYEAVRKEESKRYEAHALAMLAQPRARNNETF